MVLKLLAMARNAGKASVYLLTTSAGDFFAGLTISQNISILLFMGGLAFWLWLIRVIGVIVPRRLRADWRQEWEAELRHRETLLAEWDKLDGGPRAAKKARQGVRYHALEGLAVMDPETMEHVPADGETMGEVMFRGNVVMKGYLKNPKATQEAFRGGWFHSGDLGVMHADGYIQLKDRSKDIIISGGENISSIEVEDALYKHPAVAAAGVVAKPDEKWGESVVAVVVLAPESSLDLAELREFARERLAGYKLPTRLETVPVLPRNASGKVLKYQLRESLSR